MATNAWINLMPTGFVGQKNGNTSYSVQGLKSYSSWSIGCSKYALTQRMMCCHSMRTHNGCAGKRAFYIRISNFAHNVHPESVPIADSICVHCPRNKIYNRYRYKKRSCGYITRSRVQDTEYGEAYTMRTHPFAAVPAMTLAFVAAMHVQLLSPAANAAEDISEQYLSPYERRLAQTQRRKELLSKARKQAEEKAAFVNDDTMEASQKSDDLSKDLLESKKEDNNTNKNTDRGSLDNSNDYTQMMKRLKGSSSSYDAMVKKSPSLSSVPSSPAVSDTLPFSQTPQPMHGDSSDRLESDSKTAKQTNDSNSSSAFSLPSVSLPKIELPAITLPQSESVKQDKLQEDVQENEKKEVGNATPGIIFKSKSERIGNAVGRNENDSTDAQIKSSSYSSEIHGQSMEFPNPETLKESRTEANLGSVQNNKDGKTKHDVDKYVRKDKHKSGLPLPVAELIVLGSIFGVSFVLFSFGTEIEKLQSTLNKALENIGRK